MRIFKEILKLGKLLPEHTPDLFYDKIKYIKQMADNINFSIVFSINFGLYMEQIEDAMDAISFLLENNINNISLNYMTVLPGSRIYRNIEHFKNITILESPTRLPLRTYYNCYNMSGIKLLISHMGIWIILYIILIYIISIY